MRFLFVLCYSSILFFSLGCNRVVSVKKEWSAYLGPATTVLELDIWPSNDHRREHLFVNEDYYLGERSPLDWNAQDNVYSVGKLSAGSLVEILDIRAVKYLLGNIRESRHSFYYIIEFENEQNGQSMQASTKYRYLKFEDAQ